MNQNIEIEFKNIITKEEFKQLIDFFSIPEKQFVVQENHYFDTSNFSLKNKESALRIRLKKGEYELTLKQPAKEGLLETNESLSSDEAKDLLNGGRLPNGPIKNLIEKMGITTKEISYFGTLKTNRAEFVYESGLLVLDHSSYLNVEDYELEYEVTNKLEGQKIFEKLLISLQIPLRETENKIRRFYRVKQQQI